MKILVRKGADINAIDKHKRTPMHYAALFGTLDAIKFLVDNEATLGYRDFNGYIAADYLKDNENLSEDEKIIAEKLLHHP